MASLDWMDGAEFVVDLIRIVQEHKKRNRIDCDSGEIVLWLYDRIQQTKARTTVAGRLVEAAVRTKSDAVVSASNLMTEAFSIGSRKSPQRVDTGTMAEALIKKFCTVWPFCSKGDK